MKDGTTDFSNVRLDLDSDYFAKWIDRLEQQVSPFISEGPTPLVIAFRGESAFLSSLPPCRDLIALQALYQLQSARESGDAEKLIESTMIFAQQVKDIESIEIWKVDPVRASVASAKKREQGKSWAESSNAAHVELHEKYQPKVEALMAEGYSYTKATDELAARLGVSGRTVRNNTTNPSPKNRGRQR